MKNYFNKIYKSNLYISEYGGNKILIFDILGCFNYWIGNYDYDKIKNKVELNRGKNILRVHLNKPHAIKIDSDKNFYLVDSWNHRIIKFNKRGRLLGWIGNQKNDKINHKYNFLGNSKAGNDLGVFNVPIDLVFYKNFMYIADCNNHRLVKVSLKGRSIGWFGESVINSKKFWKNEKHKSKSSNGFFGFRNPYGTRIKDNTIYVTDNNNFRIKVIKSKKLFNQNVSI